MIPGPGEQGPGKVIYSNEPEPILQAVGQFYDGYLAAAERFTTKNPKPKRGNGQ
jgi:hypothetical protein